ncbi:MAG: hypothetical protein ACU85E_14430 [Gammaproteobacteria bacterium]
MPSFQPSTQTMIGYINGGLQVETSTLANATYLLGVGATQTELFNVTGRILLLQLYIELITAASANATTVQFNCTFTTPVIALNAMGAACAAITSLGQGGRIVHVGGAVATAAVITDSPGLSDVTCVTPHIVGGHGFVGTIGIVAGTADQASGTFRAIAHYVPYSAGAYVTAAL